MQCAAHPSVETELACGRCGKPICPRCLVYSPVGARCRDCAQVRRLPTYHIGALYLARAAGASVVTGAVLGGLWRLLVPLSIGFLAFFAGLAIGYAVGEAVSMAANRKQGPPLQLLAGAGVVLAYLVRNIAFGGPLLPSTDVQGYVAVILGVAVAVGRVRA